MNNVLYTLIRSFFILSSFHVHIFLDGFFSGEFVTTNEFEEHHFHGTHSFYSPLDLLFSFFFLLKCHCF